MSMLTSSNLELTAHRQLTPTFCKGWITLNGMWPVRDQYQFFAVVDKLDSKPKVRVNIDSCVQTLDLTLGKAQKKECLNRKNSILGKLIIVEIPEYSFASSSVKRQLECYLVHVYSQKETCKIAREFPYEYHFFFPRKTDTELAPNVDFVKQPDSSSESSDSESSDSEYDSDAIFTAVCSKLPQEKEEKEDSGITIIPAKDKPLPVHRNQEEPKVQEEIIEQAHMPTRNLPDLKEQHDVKVYLQYSSDNIHQKAFCYCGLNLPTGEEYTVKIDELLLENFIGKDIIQAKREIAVLEDELSQLPIKRACLQKEIDDCNAEKEELIQSDAPKKQIKEVSNKFYKLLNEFKKLDENDIKDKIEKKFDRISRCQAAEKFVPDYLKYHGSFNGLVVRVSLNSNNDGYFTAKRVHAIKWNEDLIMFKDFSEAVILSEEDYPELPVRTTANIADRPTLRHRASGEAYMPAIGSSYRSMFPSNPLPEITFGGF